MVALIRTASYENKQTSWFKSIYKTMSIFINNKNFVEKNLKKFEYRHGHITIT